MPRRKSQPSALSNDSLPRRLDVTPTQSDPTVYSRSPLERTHSSMIVRSSSRHRKLTKEKSGSGSRNRSILDIKTFFSPQRKEKVEQSPMVISSVVQAVHVQHVGQDGANEFVLRLLKQRKEKYAHIHHEINKGPTSGYFHIRSSTNMSNQFRNMITSENIKDVSHFR